MKAKFEVFSMPTTDDAFKAIIRRYKEKHGVAPNRVAFRGKPPEKMAAPDGIKLVTASFKVLHGYVAVYKEEDDGEQEG